MKYFKSLNRKLLIPTLFIVLYFASTSSVFALVEEITPVTTPTSDSTPAVVIKSDTAGVVSSAGGCKPLADLGTIAANTNVRVALGNVSGGGLADGTYDTCEIIITSAAGVASSIVLTTFVIDTQALPPTPSLSEDTGELSDDKLTNNGLVNLAGLEEGATWEYTIDDGVTWSDGTGSSIAETVFGDDGLKKLKVRQTDALSNASDASDEFSFTLDKTSPTVSQTPSITCTGCTESVANIGNTLTATIIFSEDIDETDVASENNVTIAGESATLSYDSATITAAIVVSPSSTAGVVEDIGISGFKDIAGNKVVALESQTVDPATFTVDVPVPTSGGGGLKNRGTGESSNFSNHFRSSGGGGGKAKVVERREVEDLGAPDDKSKGSNRKKSGYEEIKAPDNKPKASKERGVKNKEELVDDRLRNPLTLGSSGKRVEKIQKLLNGSNCRVATEGAGSVGQETEYFGPRTESAVKCYQKELGLEETGVVDDKFYKVLQGDIKIISAEPEREKRIEELKEDLNELLNSLKMTLLEESNK